MTLLKPSQLRELYGEPDDGTFTHEGHEYNLNGILNATVGYPVKDYAVKNLRWVIKYDPMSARDQARIGSADISAPLLIVFDEKEGKMVVIDGIHRLVKAVQQKIEKVPCVVVSQELIDRYRIS